MQKTNILSLSTKTTDEIIRTELTPEELAGMKDSVSTNLMKQIDLEEELQEIKDGFKMQLNPIKKDNRQLLRHIRNGYIDDRMTVYNVPDDDRLVIEFYNQEGTKVGERKMTPEERPSIQFKKESVN